jgi:hypothetical protein
MTGTEVALVISASGSFLSSIVAGISALISLNNSKKIDEVHKTTNSLAARNEAIAKELGVRQGIEQQKANPS